MTFIPAAVKCAPVSQCACKKKKTQKLAVYAAASTNYCGEKRNVLIVSVLLPIAVNFELRSKTQRRIEVLVMGPVRNPVLSQRVRLFSLLPLVWESNQNSRVAGARPNQQPIGGSDPNHGGILSPPRAVRWVKLVCVCFITAGPITKLFAWGEEESGGHVLCG